jgi:hypothetical protein
MLGLVDYGSDSDTDHQPPPPAKKTQRPPKKIAITLPALKDASADESEEPERPVKRRKTGAGASSLLSILPTPKQANILPASQQVLGGGKGSSFAFRTQPPLPDTIIGDHKALPSSADLGQAPDVPAQSTATLFRPLSLAKGKKNLSVEEPGINHIAKPPTQTSLPTPNVDFFSLGEANTLCDSILSYEL